MKADWSRRVVHLIQKFYGADVEKRLRELKRTDRLPRDELRHLQWQRLEVLLAHAYAHVPYYRSLWREAGIHPSDVRDWRDFEKLPLLEKERIQARNQELRATGLGKTPLSFGRSSGSTGLPMPFVRTQDAKARFWAAQFRGYGWHGISPSDRQGRLYGVPFDRRNSRKEVLKDWVMNRRRISVFDLTETKMRVYARQLNRFMPVYLNGYSSWLVRFAEFMQAERKRAAYPWIPLKGVVSTSEVLSAADRALVEAVFGCRAIDEYGAAEIGLVAISCPAGRLHTVAENMVLETIPADRESMAIENLPPQPVEVVVTDLHNFAMPFIRYRLGDLLATAPDPSAACPCGRQHPVIGPILGRTNSHAITPEGKIVGGQFFKYLADWSVNRGGGIRQFVARQEAIDRITYYIVKDANYSEAALKFILDTSRDHLGPSVRISVEFLESLPRTLTGKLMNFSSALNVEEILARMDGS